MLGVPLSLTFVDESHEPESGIRNRKRANSVLCGSTSLFIPRLYQRLQRRDGSNDIAAAARKAELGLIGALRAGDDS
jgi:hypothetical protein